MTAMIVAAALLAGKVAASATFAEAAPPATLPAEDLEIVDNGPEESLSDDPIAPAMSADSMGGVPAPSARPATINATSGSVARRERAERRRAGRGARDQEVVDLPAPITRPILVDTRALDATVEARAKAAVREPPVELPPIPRPQGLRPPADGGRWNGRPPR
jgi:hypothetical protein